MHMWWKCDVSHPVPWYMDEIIFFELRTPVSEEITSDSKFKANLMVHYIRLQNYWRDLSCSGDSVPSTGHRLSLSHHPVHRFCCICYVITKICFSFDLPPMLEIFTTPSPAVVLLSSWSLFRLMDILFLLCFMLCVSLFSLYKN